ncbi:MAG: glycosyltransferase family 4 protein [Candidatus Omnitrophica bacterium]|nr:glycosyltransferase family 4 protein [Candidatus Omnitrophota bacterium]MBU1997705.1 glycosyltransferase family 4 protein [Candidatus Omnitrophota bacterium]MBU4333488.1 glycosyltransferase family 4 protein [Candidatus Omnitrophota bacterium]
MNKKEKILICGILPPPNFGHSMMYKMLMDSKFVDEFDIIFLNMKFWSYKQHKKVTIDKLLKLIKYYLQYVFILIFKRPDYVLYNMSFYKMPFLKDFLFCFTANIFRCKFIVHDLGQYLSELYENSSPFMKKLVLWFVGHIEASIIMGENVRKVYEGFVPQERLIVVPGSSHDTADLVVEPLSTEKKKELGVKVLYFSYLSVSKGIWTGLEAAKKVVEKNKEVSFIFAGPVESAELEEKISEYIKKHKLEANIDIVGYIEGEYERTQYFRNCDMFIFPTHRDVFGIVLLHAMAESKPLIASKEGTIPEIVDDGKTGLLFPKGDYLSLSENILILANGADLRNQMGRAGRQKYLDKYSPEVYGQHMISAIKQICSICLKNFKK